MRKCGLATITAMIACPGVYADGLGVVHRHLAVDRYSQDVFMQGWSVQGRSDRPVSITVTVYGQNFNADDMFISFSPDQQVLEYTVTEEDVTRRWTDLDGVERCEWYVYLYLCCPRMPASPGEVWPVGWYWYTTSDTPSDFNYFYRVRIPGISTTGGFIHVNPGNTAPVANAGPDQIVEQESHEGTQVTLDGSGSSDADSTPGTNDDIVSFQWYEGTTLLGIGETMDYTFQLGEHIVTLVVSDSSGETDDDEVTITVVDTTAPTISKISASPDTLWPANHKMLEVVVDVGAEDICDSEPSCRILGVTANESIHGAGDPEPDWEITGDLTVNLRAERAGGGNGRIYTINVVCEDLSGNSTDAIVEVAVPHDQGKGKGKQK